MARTTEELAQDYTAMGHSVDLINAIIAGTQMADESAVDRQACVDLLEAVTEILATEGDF